MAGRKTKLTPECKEHIFDCVRAGISNQGSTAKTVGITEQTLSNWLARGEKAKGGPFFLGSTRIRVWVEDGISG